MTSKHFPNLLGTSKQRFGPPFRTLNFRCFSKFWSKILKNMDFPKSIAFHLVHRGHAKHYGNKTDRCVGFFARSDNSSCTSSFYVFFCFAFAFYFCISSCILLCIFYFVLHSLSIFIFCFAFAWAMT